MFMHKTTAASTTANDELNSNCQTDMANMRHDLFAGRQAGYLRCLLPFKYAFFSPGKGGHLKLLISFVTARIRIFEQSFFQRTII